MVRNAIHYFYPSHSTTFIIVLLSSVLILLSRPPESKFDSNSLGSWTRMIPECFPQVAKRVRTHLQKPEPKLFSRRRLILIRISPAVHFAFVEACA